MRLTASFCISGFKRTFLLFSFRFLQFLFAHRILTLILDLFAMVIDRPVISVFSVTMISQDIFYLYLKDRRATSESALKRICPRLSLISLPKQISQTTLSVLERARSQIRINMPFSAQSCPARKN